MKNILLTISSALFLSSCVNKEPNFNELFRSSSFKLESATGSGTGFFIKTGPEGKVQLVTAKHVCVGIDHEDGINLIGGIYPTRVYIQRLDTVNDLCTLSFPEHLLLTGIKPLLLSEVEPRVFSKVVVGGFPGSLNLIINQGYYAGIISTFQKVKEAEDPKECTDEGLRPFSDGFFGVICASEKKMPSMTAKVYPGHSGSAVVNEDGQVVGVAVMTSTPSYSGIIVGLKELRSFLNE